MQMMLISVRLSAVLACGLLGLVPSVRAQAKVDAELSIKDGRTEFKAGEPLVLVVTLRARGEPVALRSGPPPLNDKIIFTEESAGSPWKNDYPRWNPAGGDVIYMQRPQPGGELRSTVLLNEDYRFDKPGRYTLRVRTPADRGAVLTNTVSFDVTLPSPQAEAQQAQDVAALLRQPGKGCNADMRAAAQKLRGLGGDEATQIKLDILLGKVKSKNCGQDFSEGLWFARNRPMVVNALEQAFDDPARVPARQHVMRGPQVMASWEPALRSDDLVFQWVMLKSSLLAQGPADAMRDFAIAHQVAAVAMHRMATTLPQREGESRFQAAWMVLQFLFDDPTASGTPDFVAARDIVAQNLERLDSFRLAGLLRSTALDEDQVLAALERQLQQHPDDAAALNALVTRRPAVAEPYVVREICKMNAMQFDQFSKLPRATLPDVDDCLRRQLASQEEQAGSSTGQIRLGSTLAFVARFASAALVPDVARLLPKLQGQLLPNSRAAALVYLMRWEPQRYAPQFEAALAASAADIGDTLGFTAQKVGALPADGMQAVFRKALGQGDPVQVARAAQVLSSLGAPEDRVLLVERLQRLRAALRSAGVAASIEDQRLESTLVAALLGGKGWSREEGLAVMAACVSAQCRTDFRLR